MPADLVVAGCIAMLPGAGEGGRFDFVADSAVVVRDGVIQAITSARDAVGLPSAERIDARWQLAMPGFINCHTHTPMVALRGIAEDMAAEEWFNDWIWPIESNLTDPVVELGAVLACAEVIRGGVTSFADHYFAMDRVAAAVTASGLRANLGSAYFSSQGAEGRERSLDFALRLRGAAGGRITTSLTPHAPYTVDDSDLAATAELAREHRLLVHIHAAENQAQTDSSLERYGVSPIQVLARAGLLDVGLLVAHGTGIRREDLAMLQGSSGRIAVATAPKGYLKFGWGTTPIRALRSIGIPVGLATDGAASSNTLDVWESMTLIALVQKSVEADPTWMTARQALDHATRQSARAIGLEGVVGALTPGRRADLILVDLTGPHTQPLHDIAAPLVPKARSSDVLTTIVDGRVLMRDRRLPTLDVPAIVGELAGRITELVKRRADRSIQDYRAEGYDLTRHPPPRLVASFAAHQQRVVRRVVVPYGRPHRGCHRALVQ
ncbi:amidohydrolase [Streptomyces sp. H27-C3]|uniref:amidohydrolase n=1 Tax=Streptomyces sp. H27-C3 TaxID=3046305 RepID=UPI0024B943EC|nr:amidohydrolase [Streptomyces sp. H27-C3]MDJ0461710.1 amidohydrolase [Streptomyces sp. H27-C3]